MDLVLRIAGTVAVGALATAFFAVLAGGMVGAMAGLAWLAFNFEPAAWFLAVLAALLVLHWIGKEVLDW